MELHEYERNTYEQEDLQFYFLKKIVVTHADGLQTSRLTIK